MTDKNLEEVTLSTITIFEGNVTTYTVEMVELPNGERAQREIVRHDQASAILPLTDDGKAVFVKQFRKPLDRAIYEIPAGLMDPEDGDDPLSSAKRELEEETGLIAHDWEPLTDFYSSPGFTDEKLYMFVARDLEKLDNPRAQDDDEFIEIAYLTFDEAWSLYEKREIADAKTVFALFHWKSLLEK